MYVECMHMYMCMYACMSVKGVCLHVEVRDQCWVFFPLPSSYFSEAGDITAPTAHQVNCLRVQQSPETCFPASTVLELQACSAMTGLRVWTLESKLRLART